MNTKMGKNMQNSSNPLQKKAQFNRPNFPGTTPKKISGNGGFT